MKHLLVTLFLIILSNISSAQSGWGYVNYTSYKTHAGNGSTSQYPAHASNAAEFDVMFNTANSNTTITHTGEVPISYLYNGSLQTPRWGSEYYGYKFEFWFVPQQTGTYWFGTNSDDASDILIDGVVVVSYYGGHGAGGFQNGSKSMVAGQRYSVVYRGQEYGGGDVFYFQWARPSAPNTYSYWTNEVTNINSTPTKKAIMNFDFGSTLDETKFSAGGNVLSSLGSVDITNSLDTLKIPNGYKALTSAGQVEWCVIYDYDAVNKRYRVGIDNREFTGTNVSANSVSKLKLFDLWDGPVTYKSSDIYWNEYWIYTPTQFNFTASSFASNIRAGNGFYGVSAEFTFTESLEYNPQSVTITTTNTLSTLYNSIVSVTDVYLAFKELANGGIFGNQSGLEFGYGIQYKNADINNDGYFNEADVFALLQHLTGKKNIVDTFTLPNTLKIIPTTNYNNISKSNWNTTPSYLADTISFDINTNKAIDTFNYAITWKGDVNLSHSATPLSNGITNMTVRSMSVMSNSITNEVNAIIMSEIVGNSIILTLSVDPLQQELVGTQFQLNYDNSKLKFEKVEFTTKGNPTNYGINRGDFINVGSLVSDGSTILDKTTEYKIIFTPTDNTTDILGLTSIIPIDAVNKAGKQLKIKLK